MIFTLDQKEKLEEFCGLTDTKVSLDDIVRQQPDRLVMICDRNEYAICTLWYSVVPKLDGDRIGYFGNFSANGAKIAKTLLEEVHVFASQQAITRMIAPINGSTWEDYRFVIESTDTPPFFMESVNPPEYPRFLLDAGYTPFSSYYSSLCTDLSIYDKRLDLLARRGSLNDITYRSLNPEDFEADMKRIYDLSLLAFEKNYLYTPISFEHFLGRYMKIKLVLVPELFLIAEKGAQLVGFIFSIPDLLQKLPDTVVCKTIAVHPEFRGKGLGSVLLDVTHKTVKEMGFKKIIHALMYEDNTSLKMSNVYGKPFRKYSLFSRRI